MICKPLSLALPPGSRVRRRMNGRSRDAPLRWRLLLLNGLACTRDETADGQSPSSHHVFRSGVSPRRVTGLRSFLRGYLNRIHRFGLYGFALNGLVSTFLEMPGCYFGRFVPYRRKFIQTGVSQADVSGFTYGKIGWKKVRVWNIYVGEERTVNNKGLVEGLPSGVHRIYTEDKVRCTELPVSVHKNFGPEHKVQVSNVNHSDVLSKHRTVCSKRWRVRVRVNKIVTNGRDIIN